MAAKKNVTLEVPVTVTSGTAKAVNDMKSMIVQIVWTGTATYKVMQSFDGTNFEQKGSDLTASGSQALDDAAVAVRIDCSAHTSGTPTAAVSGLQLSGLPE